VSEYVDLQLFVCGEFMSYLCYLCLFTYSCVIHNHIVLCFCFVCLRFVSCVTNVASFSGLFIVDAPPVFSNVYWHTFFDFERTWWRLFQKRVVSTNFDIYVFIISHSNQKRLLL